MALVPVIIPLVVKLLCSKKELQINMKEQEKKYPSNMEIKNLRVLKIIFPDRGNYRSRPICSQLRSFDRYVDVW